MRGDDFPSVRNDKNSGRRLSINILDHFINKKMETLYTIINAIALLGWLSLIFLPKKKWTFTIVVSGGVSAILALFYIYFIVGSITGEATGGDFSSLKGLKALFQSDIALLAGWAHYLVFDLFIGAWMTSNAQRLGLAHWKIIPCLLFTFMMGPVGLLLYFIVRANLTKKILHDNF
jgi:hypothetical protein